MLRLTAREVRSWRNPAAPLNSQPADRPLLRLAAIAEVCADDVIGEAADDQISKNAGISSRR
jgi:hypothetical protein